MRWMAGGGEEENDREEDKNGDQGDPDRDQHPALPGRRQPPPASRHFFPANEQLWKHVLKTVNYPDLCRKDRGPAKTQAKTTVETAARLNEQQLSQHERGQRHVCTAQGVARESCRKPDRRCRSNVEHTRDIERRRCARRSRAQ